MNFMGSQVTSGSQGRNPRLSEYFAVVGLPEGPLMVADVSSNFADCSSRSNESRSVRAPGGHTIEEDSGEGEDDEEEDDFDDEAPAPLEALKRRRRTYGSSELGRMTARMDVGEAPLAMRYRAKVLHRFPAYEHDGSAFPTNLALFCLPGRQRFERVFRCCVSWASGGCRCRESGSGISRAGRRVIVLALSEALEHLELTDD